MANLSFGLPDLGVTTLDNVLEDVRRITGAVRSSTSGRRGHRVRRRADDRPHRAGHDRAGAAALHIEDQVSDKRCGHRPGKALVSRQEMVDRVRAAVDARTDGGFLIMARTDAVSVEGMDRAVERAVGEHRDRASAAESPADRRPPGAKAGVRPDPGRGPARNGVPSRSQ